MPQASGAPVVRPLIIGNWKMNGAAASLTEVGVVAASLAAEPVGADVALCPPNTLVAAAASIAAGSPVVIGAQDCHAQPSGAFTGDVSAEMLADAGARLVIVGHSERRAHHAETDAQVASKALAAARVGMAPVICIGESLAQREAGQTLAAIEAELLGSVPPQLAGVAFAVAYEPRWAIGTGLTPALEEIAAVHALIRDILNTRFGAAGRAVDILYGGSVTAANMRQILGVPHVGGLLVGGASLTAASFLSVLRAA